MIHGDTRARGLLAAGALLGAALAGVSLVGADSAEVIPEEAVAVVDGQPVLRADYERALAAVAADRRGGRLTEEDRRRVLDRLVDQELLVKRALELGLASRDRKVRNDLATAMIDLLKARAEELPEPDEGELRRFYADHRGRFATAPRMVVEHAYFRVDRTDPPGEEGDDQTARRRAEEAMARGTLRGTGDPFDLPLPQGPVPASVLAQRLGPTAARGALTLEVGDIGGPWRASDGYHVIRLLEKAEGDAPAFEDVIEQVRVERRRAAGERALTRFLSDRRERATIRMRNGP